MNTVQTIAKNTTVLILAQSISMILSLTLLIFVARFLGDVDYGKYSFAIKFTGLFAIFADLGLSTLMIREVARDKSLSGKYLSNIAVIKVILSVATFAFIVFIINLMHYPADTTTAVYLAGISVILTSFSGLFRSIFAAFERMEYEALLSTILTIIHVSLGLLVLFSGYGLIELVTVFVIVGIINFSLSFSVVIKKFVKPKLEIDFGLWKHLILNGAPFSLTMIAGVIYLQIDTVMLSVMKGDAPVGWYSAAYTLVLALLVIPDIFGYAIFPAMSKLFVSSKDSLKIMLEKSSKYLFSLGLPISIGTILLADRIILMIYGEEYIHSIIALQILSLYLPLRYLNHATSYTLSAINKEPLRTLSVTITAASNVVLNLFLIPAFSFVGAGIATVLTEIILFAFYFYFVAKHFHRLRLQKIVIKPCISCLAMGGFVFYFKDANLFLLVISAAVIYFGMLYLLRAFDSDDERMFKGLMRDAINKMRSIIK